jgi:hypothetical protein
MLRTAMVSTRANRNYGPPDGISTGEFDSLTRRSFDRQRVLYRSPALPARVESSTSSVGARKYIIILVYGSHVASFFVVLDTRFGEQSVCLLSRSVRTN